MAIDIATLLFSVHGRDAAPPVPARLVAFAVDRDGTEIATVRLASAPFDWCVYAIGGWAPAAVRAYLLKAASLFRCLAWQGGARLSLNCHCRQRTLVAVAVLVPSA